MSDPFTDDSDAQQAAEFVMQEYELKLRRAREWISTPAFREHFEDEHPSMFVQMILFFMSSSRIFITRSSRLWRKYQELRELGKLVFAAPVIGNVALSTEPDKCAPVAALGPEEPDLKTVKEAIVFSEWLAEIYFSGSRDGTQKKCEAIIRDDRYQPMRSRLLPRQETGGTQLRLFDLFIACKTMMIGDERVPLIPLLVHPAGRPFVPIPWHVLLSIPPALPKGPPPLPKSSTQAVATTQSPAMPAKVTHPSEPKPFELVLQGGEDTAALEAHIEANLGPIETVYHELVSYKVHLNVHFIPPSEGSPFITLVTTGMSARPMSVPDGAEAFKHAELMIRLPADWNLRRDQLGQLEPSDYDDEQSYWPIRWLKTIPGFPHNSGGWMGPGHTILNGDPPEPLADNLPFRGFIISYPKHVPDGFHQLTIGSGKVVNFYALVPITAEEMNYKLNHGEEALLAQLASHGVSEVVDVNRGSAV